jgi:signal peptidase II
MSNDATPTIRDRTAWITAAVILVLDQAIKLLVTDALAPFQHKPIIPGFFNLVLVYNKGAAFGILNDPDSSWQVLFFILITLLAVIILVYLLRTTARRDRFFILGLGAILGGALGNLVDRIRLGKVIDYLDFSVRQFHWPAFNIADMAITLGALALIISLYRNERHASNTD